VILLPTIEDAIHKYNEARSGMEVSLKILEEAKEMALYCKSEYSNVTDLNIVGDLLKEINRKLELIKV
jgi:hypothetical protein